jgi:hypothetical protein
MSDERIRICIDRVLPDEYQPARAAAAHAFRDLLRSNTTLSDVDKQFIATMYPKS